MPKACGLLFPRAYYLEPVCIALSDSGASFPRLLTRPLSPSGPWKGVSKQQSKAEAIFFSCSLGWYCFSIVDTPVLINYEVCFARQFSALYRILFFFFFKGEIIVKLHGD